MKIATSRFATVAVVAALSCAASNEATGPTPSPGAADVPTAAAPEGWLMLSNTTYGFTIAYPPQFVVLPETTPAPGGSVLRVRFQDKNISGVGATLEPPRFTIEVFTSQGLSLREWLQQAGRLPAGAAIAPIVLSGAREGVKVQQPQQLAPNEFYYFLTNRYVYALTPLGAESASMLSSFRLQ